MVTNNSWETCYQCNLFMYCLSREVQQAKHLELILLIIDVVTSTEDLERHCIQTPRHKILQNCCLFSVHSKTRNNLKLHEKQKINFK